eukprot:TRINITY_DN362_c0_g2_i1.p1 TRINITY_DN362_c0_g2~~TRINITY_DN362_c0_g2_i1.p1  ORF type:complete len:1521 (-),score=306.90 TRINITY_DN362_c0_g2_i1:114-4676(-)
MRFLILAIIGSAALGQACQVGNTEDFVDVPGGFFRNGLNLFFLESSPNATKVCSPFLVATCPSSIQLHGTGMYITGKVKNGVLFLSSCRKTDARLGISASGLVGSPRLSFVAVTINNRPPTHQFVDFDRDFDTFLGRVTKALDACSGGVFRPTFDVLNVEVVLTPSQMMVCDPDTTVFEELVLGHLQAAGVEEPSPDHAVFLLMPTHPSCAFKTSTSSPVSFGEQNPRPVAIVNGDAGLTAPALAAAVVRVLTGPLTANEYRASESFGYAGATEEDPTDFLGAAESMNCPGPVLQLVLGWITPTAANVVTLTEWPGPDGIVRMRCLDDRRGAERFVGPAPVLLLVPVDVAKEPSAKAFLIPDFAPSLAEQGADPASAVFVVAVRCAVGANQAMGSVHEGVNVYLAAETAAGGWPVSSRLTTRALQRKGDRLDTWWLSNSLMAVRVASQSAVYASASPIVDVLINPRSEENEAVHDNTVSPSVVCDVEMKVSFGGACEYYHSSTLAASGFAVTGRCPGADDNEWPYTLEFGAAGELPYVPRGRNLTITTGYVTDPFYVLVGECGSWTCVASNAGQGVVGGSVSTDDILAKMSSGQRAFILVTTQTRGEEVTLCTDLDLPVVVSLAGDGSRAISVGAFTIGGKYDEVTLPQYAHENLNKVTTNPLEKIHNPQWRPGPGPTWNDYFLYTKPVEVKEMSSAMPKEQVVDFRESRRKMQRSSAGGRSSAAMPHAHGLGTAGRRRAVVVAGGGDVRVGVVASSLYNTDLDAAFRSGSVGTCHSLRVSVALWHPLAADASVPVIVMITTSQGLFEGAISCVMPPQTMTGGVAEWFASVGCPLSVAGSTELVVLVARATDVDLGSSTTRIDVPEVWHAVTVPMMTGHTEGSYRGLHVETTLTIPGVALARRTDGADVPYLAPAPGDVCPRPIISDIDGNAALPPSTVDNVVRTSVETLSLHCDSSVTVPLLGLSAADAPTSCIASNPYVGNVSDTIPKRGVWVSLAVKEAFLPTDAEGVVTLQNTTLELSSCGSTVPMVPIFTTHCGPLHSPPNESDVFVPTCLNQAQVDACGSGGFVATLRRRVAARFWVYVLLPDPFRSGEATLRLTCRPSSITSDAVAFAGGDSASARAVATVIGTRDASNASGDALSDGCLCPSATTTTTRQAAEFLFATGVACECARDGVVSRSQKSHYERLVRSLGDSDDTARKGSGAHVATDPAGSSSARSVAGVAVAARTRAASLATARVPTTSRSVRGPGKNASGTPSHLRLGRHRLSARDVAHAGVRLVPTRRGMRVRSSPQSGQRGLAALPVVEHGRWPAAAEGVGLISAAAPDVTSLRSLASARKARQAVSASDPLSANVLSRGQSITVLLCTTSACTDSAAAAEYLARASSEIGAALTVCVSGNETFSCPPQAAEVDDPSASKKGLLGLLGLLGLIPLICCCLLGVFLCVLCSRPRQKKMSSVPMGTFTMQPTSLMATVALEPPVFSTVAGMPSAVSAFGTHPQPSIAPFAQPLSDCAGAGPWGH